MWPVTSIVCSLVTIVAILAERSLDRHYIQSGLANVSSSQLMRAMQLFQSLAHLHATTVIIALATFVIILLTPSRRLAALAVLPIVISIYMIMKGNTN